MTRLRLASPIDLADYDELGPARKRRRYMEAAASSAPPPSLAEEQPPLLVPQASDLSVAVPRNTAEDACLAQVLEVFPDVSHEYVRELYNSREISHMRSDGQDSTPLIIDAVLAQPQYPKQKELKRKRENEDQPHDPLEQPQFWELSSAPQYVQACLDILASDFPKVPLKYIRDQLVRHKRMYTVYESLYHFETAAAAGSQLPYGRLRIGRRPSKHARSPSQSHHSPVDDAIARELQAVKTHCEQKAASLRQKKELEEAERRNEEVSRRDGALVECGCCYTDVPANRAVACDGDEAHFFCHECIKRSADTQIGLMKYELVCFDTSGCQAGFGRCQLSEVLAPSIMQKLESLQQQDEISKAGLDGLSGCPFCEYKAICPPVEVDKEFRCLNPKCEKVSCRLCHEESHIPMSCEEHKKEKGVTTRHLVEEAMSEALIRKCPRCTLPIVKEIGCNKMTCSKCGCVMCYVCKVDITKSGYNHFGIGPKPCILHDQRDRHQDDIDRAEQEAIEKVRADNPDVDQEVLRVQNPKSRASQENVRPVPQQHPRHLPRPVLVQHVGLLRDGHVAPAPANPLRRYDATYAPQPEWRYIAREYPVVDRPAARGRAADALPHLVLPGGFHHIARRAAPENVRPAAAFGGPPPVLPHPDPARRGQNYVPPVPLAPPLPLPAQRARHQQPGVNPGAHRNAHARG